MIFSISDLNDGGLRVGEGGLVAVVAHEPGEAEEQRQLQDLPHRQARRRPAQGGLNKEQNSV